MFISENVGSIWLLSMNRNFIAASGCVHGGRRSKLALIFQMIVLHKKKSSSQNNVLWDIIVLLEV